MAVVSWALEAQQVLLSSHETHSVVQLRIGIVSDLPIVAQGDSPFTKKSILNHLKLIFEIPHARLSFEWVTS